jgi:hypothetical protein
MNETPNLDKFMREHAAREAVHADLFGRVTPEAISAQDAAIDALMKGHEARHKQWEEYEMLSMSPLRASDDNLSGYPKRPREWLDSQVLSAASPRIRDDSHIAQAMTLQPVRDLVVDGIVVLSEDRKLDIIGPPYPNVWTHKSGNAYHALASVWADPGDGMLGFDHDAGGNYDASGTVITHKQTNSGAGVYIRFVPRIAPGIAQIRPYAPYTYQWLTWGIVGRGDNSAIFGIRVWSWNLQGGDFATEQDCQYFIWNDWTPTHSPYLDTSSSPSWFQNEDNSVPEWDDDNAFLFGKQAPYFKTRPNRVYVAAIWCFGKCFSVDTLEHPRSSIGRLHAQVPWVVIGYQ